MKVKHWKPFFNWELSLTSRWIKLLLNFVRYWNWQCQPTTFSFDFFILLVSDVTITHETELRLEKFDFAPPNKYRVGSRVASESRAKNEFANCEKTFKIKIWNLKNRNITLACDIGEKKILGPFSCYRVVIWIFSISVSQFTCIWLKKKRSWKTA